MIYFQGDEGKENLGGRVSFAKYQSPWKYQPRTGKKMAHFHQRTVFLHSSLQGKDPQKS